MSGVTGHQKCYMWRGWQGMEEHVVCNASAHTSPLSHWMLQNNETRFHWTRFLSCSKIKSIKNFEKWQPEHYINPESPGWSHRLQGREADLAVNTISSQTRKQGQKIKQEFSALRLLGWDINHPSPCKSPNQECKRIIQKEGQIIAHNVLVRTWTGDSRADPPVHPVGFLHWLAQIFLSANIRVRKAWGSLVVSLFSAHSEDKELRGQWGGEF